MSEIHEHSPEQPEELTEQINREWVTSFKIKFFLKLLNGFAQNMALYSQIQENFYNIDFDALKSQWKKIILLDVDECITHHHWDICDKTKNKLQELSEDFYIVITSNNKNGPRYNFIRERWLQWKIILMDSEFPKPNSENFLSCLDNVETSDVMEDFDYKEFARYILSLPEEIATDDMYAFSKIYSEVKSLLTDTLRANNKNDLYDATITRFTSLINNLLQSGENKGDLEKFIKAYSSVMIWDNPNTDWWAILLWIYFMIVDNPEFKTGLIPEGIDSFVEKVKLLISELIRAHWREHILGIIKKAKN